MAGKHPDDRELNRYFEEAYRFDFYQAVKVLEQVARARAEDSGGVVNPPGGTVEPEDEPLRFKQNVSLAFKASDVERVEAAPRDGDRPAMWVNFYGLAGARGPLPLFYTDLVRDRVRLGDHGLAAFLDLFNHRTISLAYRIRQRHRPTLHTTLPEQHPFARYLAAFAGLHGTAAQAAFDVHENPRFEGERGLEARDLLYYAGLFWHRDRSMLGLERLLSHFFDVPVRGRQLCGRWVNLASTERSMLTALGSHHNQLGVSTVAGQRVFDAQSRFELLVGPMEWDAYVDLLPSGRQFAAVHKLTRFYTRSAFDFGLDLTIKPEVIHTNQPPLGSDEPGLRLGWTSWLLQKPLATEKPVRVRLTARMLPADDQPFVLLVWRDVPTDPDTLGPAAFVQFGEQIVEVVPAETTGQPAPLLLTRLESGEIPLRHRLLVACRADGPPDKSLVEFLRTLRASAGERPMGVLLMRRPGPYTWSAPIPDELVRWRKVLRAELEDDLLSVAAFEPASSLPDGAAMPGVPVGAFS